MAASASPVSRLASLAALTLVTRSVLGFAGYGTAYAGSSRFFEDSGAVFAGGGGFRYRIARKLGVDAGLDVAFGPDGGIIYIQFGHAWGGGMD